MKKFIVERHEQLRRTKTYEVEAESADQAKDMVYEDEIKPKRVYEKNLDSDTECYEVKS